LFGRASTTSTPPFGAVGFYSLLMLVNQMPRVSGVFGVILGTIVLLLVS
jgi:hypothetical protein